MALVVNDPYQAVDWAAHAKRKANLHTHTNRSDGSQAPAAVIDGYHAKGYDILALTDHDTYVTSRGPTWPWTDYGRDPATLGMLAVPGNEHSNPHHTIGFWSDLWTQQDIDAGLYTTFRSNLAYILGEIGDRGGLAMLCHPMAYAHSDQFYLDLFDAYAHLQGVEVYTNGDLFPGAVALWDRLLTAHRAAGQAWPLWATSVDDMHSLPSLGRNYTVYPMPDLTEASLRAAMTSGAFYSVLDPLGADVDRHVNGDPGFWTAAPVINSLVVTASSITVDASNYQEVQWRTDHGVRVHTGDTLSLGNDGLGSYVRAVLIGSDGSRALTQPWYLVPGGDFGGGGVRARKDGAEFTVVKARQDGVDLTFDVRSA